MKICAAFILGVGLLGLVDAKLGRSHVRSGSLTDRTHSHPQKHHAANQQYNYMGNRTSAMDRVAARAARNQDYRLKKREERQKKLLKETQQHRDLVAERELQLATPYQLGQNWFNMHPLAVNMSEYQERQLVGMASFYFATGGVNWVNKQGWLSYGGFGSECQWYNQAGEDTCDNGATLKEIELEENNLGGIINSEINMLPALVKLDLEDNAIGGSIPSQIGELTQMVDFDLQTNQLTGSLPPEMAAMATMEYLLVKENKINGTIPATFGNLTNLVWLDLSENEISGTLPSELGNMVFLEFLDVYFNDWLRGEIPSEIFSLPWLNEIKLEFNYFAGAIPTEIGLSTSLEYFNVQDNYLNGTIPAQIGNATALQELDFEDNELVGSMPTEMLMLTNLKKLQLDDNRITGTIPLGMWKMNLTRLELSENWLEGTLPIHMGLSTAMTSLGLAENQLTGHITEAIGLMDSLESLDLGNNLLTGTLPAAMSYMTNLEELYLTDNMGLTGSIPSEFANMPNLQYLYLDKTKMTGLIPAQLCGITELVFSCGVAGGLCGCGCACIPLTSAPTLPSTLPPSTATPTVPSTTSGNTTQPQSTVAPSNQTVLPTTPEAETVLPATPEAETTAPTDGVEFDDTTVIAGAAGWRDTAVPSVAVTMTETSFATQSVTELSEPGAAEDEPIDMMAPTPVPLGTLEEVANNGLPEDLYPLQICQADCDGDDECAEGLVCLDREEGDAFSIYCDGEPAEDLDYCVPATEGEDPDVPTIVGRDGGRN